MDIDKIDARLMELDHILEEENEGYLSQESVINFYDFILLFTKQPKISLTPNNEIYATWENDYDGDTKLSIMFTDSGKRIMAMFKNKKPVGQVEL